jgi:dolichol kinase
LEDIKIEEVQSNILVMLVCYAYILLILIVSKKINNHLVTRRKFVHMMIGALPLIMPFFTSPVYSFLVACPFVLITFLVSPYSPSPWLSHRISILVKITKEGHSMGLVLYALSYSILAYFFGAQPYVVASGIFPLAYGDSLAAIIGERYGKNRFKVFDWKSTQGSFGMFLGSFISLYLGLFYFSYFYSFTFLDKILTIIIVAIVGTIVEALSPKGLDNLFVPLLCAYTFLFLRGSF